MTLRLGLSTGAFYPDKSTEQVVELAASLGVTDLELMLQTPGEYDQLFFTRLARLKTEVDVTIHSLHAMQPLHPVFNAYQRRADEAWEMFARLIEGAAALDAGIIVWHGPCRQQLPDLTDIDRWIHAVDRLAGMCLDAGIVLALENVSWCALPNPRHVGGFVKRLPELSNQRAIRFTFDPFHAAEAEANAFMILNAMGDRVANVHLRDFDEERPELRTLPPGSGRLPWPALVRAIHASGYNGPMMIEGSLLSNPAAALARVREVLDPLIESARSAGGTCEEPLPPGVLEGIRLFNVGEYYDCHEEIEHEWHAERGEIRQLYQGILQIGVGFHHTRSGNHRGAVALLTDGIAKVSRFLPTCRGLDTAYLVTTSQKCLDQIEALGPNQLNEFDWDLVPVIELDDV